MPTVHVTTKSSSSVWKSPDGQREIFELELDHKGQVFKAKTYSNDISAVGWEGDVESYEKTGKPGMPAQTFVKQPAKEYSGGYSKPDMRGYQNSKGQGDQFTMYLSYAKDLAVACTTMETSSGSSSASKTTTKTTFNAALFAEMLEAVAAGGEQLYEAHNRPAETPEAKADVAVAKVLEGDPAIAQLSAVFGDEVVDVTPEAPWNPGS